MKWRVPAIGTLLGVALAVGLFVVVDSDEPRAAPTRPECVAGGERPCSADVEKGTPYRFQVLHCGLVWIVDFDRSYWDVDEATMSEDEEIRFGINSDEGTMTLTGDDVAVYRSSRGGEATLRRHEGAKTFFSCA